MSYFNTVTGQAYAPGWFLADNENCTRLTRQIPATAGIDGANGGKYVPMGTAYPGNDSNAEGIVYEDVDVTNGDMPGSVVTQGIIYEDRLAVTGANYSALTLKNLVSPKANGWQERSGTSPSYTYTDSTDTTVNTSKTYYLPGEDHTAVTNYAAELDPAKKGWYESDGGSGYELSTDTEANTSKTYYEKSDVRLVSAAKSALEGKGFVFIDTAPAVTRPY